MKAGADAPRGELLFSTAIIRDAATAALLTSPPLTADVDFTRLNFPMEQKERRGTGNQRKGFGTFVFWEAEFK